MPNQWQSKLLKLKTNTCPNGFTNRQKIEKTRIITWHNINCHGSALSPPLGPWNWGRLLTVPGAICSLLWPHVEFPWKPSHLKLQTLHKILKCRLQSRKLSVSWERPRWWYGHNENLPGGNLERSGIPHQYNEVLLSQPHSHQIDTWAPSKLEASCADLDPEPDHVEIHGKISCRQ